MWGPLLKNFPSLYRFVSLIYGSASSIVFFEPGAGLTEVVNSVGCKQGCSLGSFLFCLSIHGPLSKLQAEFKDLLIIAYCDDVHIVGDPATVIKAYRRWAYLYGAELQGEMRHGKKARAFLEHQWGPFPSKLPLRRRWFPRSSMIWML